MKFEIDLPEHQYNNIIALNSLSLGRVPYKGIIMYAINAIKNATPVDQEPTTKNDLGVDLISRTEVLKLIYEYKEKHSENRNEYPINYGTLLDMIRWVRELPSVTPQEPRKGHWIDKQRLFESCSAECSSCHKRSNGYLHDNGFSLVSKYFDFCPKCGSDNREVEE